MRFTLTIDCDGAAFGADDATSYNRVLEVGGRLRTIAKELAREPERTFGRIFDTNGNRCGEWKFEENGQ
jgi:hypothetical protein